MRNYEGLKAAGNVAPSAWTFDDNDWWLEENGLIMEKPPVVLKPGRYLVTGGRQVQSVLTVLPKAADGTQRWELADGARLIDVTHLRCRSARYRPETGASACTPAKVRASAFPVEPGGAMPHVDGCAKQDFAVLFVIGIEAA